MRVLFGAFFVGMFSGLAVGQQNPATLSIVPIGGYEVSGVQTVTLEVYFSANAPLRVEGGQYDLPCAVITSEPGGSGSLTVQSMTTDPQNDSSRGPSSNGTPFLFGPLGLGPSNSVNCITATTPSIGGVPATLVPGEVRYIGTYVYAISDCAHGSFTIGFECTDQPDGVCSGLPEATNSTRYRDDNPPGPPAGPLIPLDLPSITLIVPEGQCCVGGNCVGDVFSETCCLGLDPSALWVEGRTCFDACPECILDAHCDDGQSCNGLETCNVATGQCMPGTPPSCPGSTNCRAAVCDPSLNNFTGGCTIIHLPNGTACGSSVDTECDHPDSCLLGMCVLNWAANGAVCGSSADAPCDDPDSCFNGNCRPNFAAVGTACGSAGSSQCNSPDSCDGSGICDLHLAPNGTSCDDGSVCSLNDACSDGICTGVPRVCSDGLFCNGEESCDPSAGCLAGAAPCSVNFECDEGADECVSTGIPTASSWGLIVLALAVLSGAKAGFSRREPQD